MPRSGFGVVLAGGGTAGHVEPALNFADALRELLPDVRITALGTERGLETTLVPARGYPLELIPAVPLPRRPTGDLVTLPVRLRHSVVQVSRLLDRLDTDVVVGFGGYVALPGYLGARRRHIPVVVHEANAKAGLANRIGARFAAIVAETVPGSLPGAELVGLPLRRAIVELDRAGMQAVARAELDLDPRARVLLVFGGSQGAMHLNAVLGQALPALNGAGICVLHLHGGKNAPVAPAGPGYRPVAFLERMYLAYAAADFAVARAGAMTCAELAAVGLPALFVPLPIGNGEQRLNAASLVAVGGALLIEDSELDAAKLLETVVPLLMDPGALQLMGERAASAGHRDADVTLAKMVIDLLTKEAQK